MTDHQLGAPGAGRRRREADPDRAARPRGEERRAGSRHQLKIVPVLAGHVHAFETQLGGARIADRQRPDRAAFADPAIREVEARRLEADRRFRVIRAVKNRFGAANELGLFAMTERGLREVRNPSAIFLARGAEDVAGSVVTVVREGSRPLLVEIQALVDEASGPPRRLTVGIDQGRLNMLLAVLHRHAGVSTQGLDVYANVVGGVRIAETSADLAVLAAVRSTLGTRPVDRGLLVFGEVGLAGEIRPVPGGEERLREGAKHGFSKALVPVANIPRNTPCGIEVLGVERVDRALDFI